MPEWIISWITIALVIMPLRSTERWIHKHVQGLGLLLTNNPQAAVLIYYLVLFPGVFLHEVSQWLLAKVMGVKVKEFKLWPDTQKGAKLIRLGLVEIDPDTDMYRTTAVSIIPLVTGIAMLALIGTTRFDTAPLLAAFATGDLPTIAAGIKAFTAAPDFFLWVYLIFAFANAMLPEPHDEINWWLIIVPAVGITVFLLVLDLSILLLAWLEGPLARLAGWVSFALVMALVIDLIVMALIALMELIFSRVLNRDVEYQ